MSVVESIDSLSSSTNSQHCITMRKVKISYNKSMGYSIGTSHIMGNTSIPRATGASKPCSRISKKSTTDTRLHPQKLQEQV